MAQLDEGIPRTLKTIGIVAVTAEGAALCYRTIVSESARYLPAEVHPRIVLDNPSLHTINERLRQRDWSGVAALVGESARRLGSIGAELIVMPANAPHYAATAIAAACPVPFLSIVDVTVAACVTRGYARVGILGIGLTMSDGLYEGPLLNHGIEPIRPDEREQAQVNAVIFEQIIPARVTADGVGEVLRVIAGLAERGAEAVILGCTELPIVVTERNSPLPAIDTTRLLAKAALERALPPTARR